MPPRIVRYSAICTDWQGASAPVHPLSRRVPHAAQARAGRRGKPPGLRNSEMAERAESEKRYQGQKAYHGSSQRQRQKSVRAAVTPDEYAAIEKRARAAGLSTAAYLRACALGHLEKLVMNSVRPAEELKALVSRCLGFAPIQKADFLPGVAVYGDSGHTTSIRRRPHRMP